MGSERAYRAWNDRRLDREVWPPRNVWLGVSAERQQEANERIPDLLATPATVRFVSAEPLLGPIDFSQWLAVEKISLQGRPHWTERTGSVSDLHWMIVGGESGPGARPMQPAWARSIRDQCRAADVAFFFKQWGSHAPASVIEPLDHLPEDADVMLPTAKGKAGRHLDGRIWHEMPAVSAKAEAA
jgi:protein gp37